MFNFVTPETAKHAMNKQTNATGFSPETSSLPFSLNDFFGSIQSSFDQRQQPDLEINNQFSGLNSKVGMSNE